MNAALLCPGPSLAERFDDDFGGLRVGVNRAVRAFSCDWWAALDHGPVEREAGIRLPLLTTLAATQHLSAFQPSRLAEFPRVVTCEDLTSFYPPPARWPTYSATAGLVLCAWLGATAIDVFGADWAENAPDWDGHQHPDNRRNVDRWNDEIGVWENTVAELARRGIAVTRR